MIDIDYCKTYVRHTGMNLPPCETCPIKIPCPKYNYQDQSVFNTFHYLIKEIETLKQKVAKLEGDSYIGINSNSELFD